MKLAWKVLVGLGVLLVFISLGMDTTVSYGGGRVHNIGLHAQQQMFLILGCFVFLAGIILFTLLKMKQTSDQDAADKAASEVARAKAKEEVRGYWRRKHRAGRRRIRIPRWTQERRIFPGPCGLRAGR